MKLKTFALAILAVLATGLFVSSAQAQSFVYGVNNRNNLPTRVYGYAVNESTGVLTPIPGVNPLLTGQNGDGGTIGERIAIDSVNRRLYVINGGLARSLFVYSINGVTGALTPLPFSPIALPATFTFPNSVTVHPSGSPVVVTNGNQVASFLVTTASATPAAGSPFAAGTGVVSFSGIFSRDGNFFYCGGTNGSAFAGFSVDTASGVLTALAGSPFSTTTIANTAMATDAAGRLFIGSNQNQSRAFTTTAGIPTGVTGNPFANGFSGPNLSVDGEISPDGQFYATLDRSGARLAILRIDGSGAATTLTATTGSPFTVNGNAPTGLKYNLSGNRLFVVNGVGRNFLSFSADPATGAVAPLASQPADTLGTDGNIVGIGYFNSGLVNVDSQVSFVTTTSGLTGITGSCATAGYSNQFNINADLTNIGPNTLGSPQFQVLELQAANGTPPANPFRLRTADDFNAVDCTGGLVGASQAIPGPIAPGQVIPVNFQIAMPQVRRFRFFVSVFAIVNTPNQLRATQTRVGRLAIEATGFDAAGIPRLSATFIPEPGAPATFRVERVRATR
jgi:6-phosphogluconolactonase (cycloisomerase 2 family)